MTTFVVSAIIIVIVGLALKATIKQVKSGGCASCGSSGGCSGCPSCNCHNQDDDSLEK